MFYSRFLATILLVPCLFWGCASAGTAPPATGAGSPPGLREFYAPEVDESLYGTWVNPGYGPPGPAGKLVIYPWGLVQWFAVLADPDPRETGTSIIVERWRDESGATWYREFRRSRGGTGGDGSTFVLSRVSSDESALESISGADGWPDPSELDPGVDPTYVVYHRQK